MPELYSDPSVLVGDTAVEPFDFNTSLATFNVSFSARSRYFLHGHIWSIPSDYEINIVSNYIDVTSGIDANITIETSTNVSIRFEYDYDTYVAGKEDYFAAAVMNILINIYTDVALHDYRVSRGKGKTFSRYSTF